MPAGDAFQQKINKIFNDLPSVFVITDDILILGYTADGRNQDKPLEVNNADMLE